MIIFLFITMISCGLFGAGYCLIETAIEKRLAKKRAEQIKRAERRAEFNKKLAENKARLNQMKVFTECLMPIER